MAATRLIGAGLALSLLAGAACNSASPAAPSTSPPPATLASGAWTGVLDITSCVGGAGCRTGPEKFALRLAPDGTAVLQVDTQIWSTAPPIALNATARERPDRTVVLNGATTIGPPAEAELTLSGPPGDTLAGTIRYNVLRSPGITFAKEGRILYASRDATMTFARLQGTWAGFVTRPQCTGDCDQFDPVLNEGAVWLDLSQAGSSIGGRFNREELTGVVTGNSFTATSHMELPPERCQRGFDSGTTCLVDLTVTAETDALDRLRGEVSYRVEAVTDRNQHFAFSARADLTGVVRWP